MQINGNRQNIIGQNKIVCREIYGIPVDEDLDKTKHCWCTDVQLQKTVKNY